MDEGDGIGDGERAVAVEVALGELEFHCGWVGIVIVLAGGIDGDGVGGTEGDLVADAGCGSARCDAVVVFYVWGVAGEN